MLLTNEQIVVKARYNEALVELSHDTHRQEVGLGEVLIQFRLRARVVFRRDLGEKATEFLTLVAARDIPSPHLFHGERHLCPSAVARLFAIILHNHTVRL